MYSRAISNLVLEFGRPLHALRRGTGPPLYSGARKLDSVWIGGKFYLYKFVSEDLRLCIHGVFHGCILFKSCLGIFMFLELVLVFLKSQERKCNQFDHNQHVRC